MNVQPLRTSPRKIARRVQEGYSNPPGHCWSEPDASLARSYEKGICRDEQVTKIEEERHVNHQPLSTVGEWPELCGIDPDGSEIKWPLQKLNELPDLRRRPMETHDQCIAWHIFKN